MASTASFWEPSAPALDNLVVVESSFAAFSNRNAYVGLVLRDELGLDSELVAGVVVIVQQLLVVLENVGKGNKTWHIFSFI